MLMGLSDSFSFTVKLKPTIMSISLPLPTPTHTPIPMNTNSKVIAPLFPLGNFSVFVAEVAIGVPPVKTHLMLNINSPFTAVQCAKLPNMLSTSTEYGFDPTLSRTFFPMNATHPLCSPPLFSDSGKYCAFSFGSTISGNYAFESFFSSEVEPVVRTPFGCGILSGDGSSVVKGQAPVGYLGLGQGHPTRILGHMKVDRFSFCIPALHSAAVADETNSSVATLDFGAAASLGGSGVKTTQILRLGQRSLYYLNVTGIMVSGRLIDISTDLFAPARGSGIALDAALPFTYLAHPAYDLFKDAVANFFSVAYGMRPVETSVAGFDLCFNVSDASATPAAPSFVLEFEGGAAYLELQNGVPFFHAEDAAQSCMLVFAIQPGGRSSSIVGISGQTGYKFLYDVGASRMSFAPLQC